MNKIKILGVLALLLIGVIAFIWGQKMNQPTISIEMPKQMYQKGEVTRIRIVNNSPEDICFSTCYPYYLQHKEKEWNSYDYPACPEENLNLPCISPGEKKDFEFTLSDKLKSGVHRIAVPVNKRGEKGQEFKEDKKAYSDPFEVK
ncbi:MAG: hypothetical protein V5A57_02840 [Candidatus Paceibacterota bacterium]